MAEDPDRTQTREGSGAPEERFWSLRPNEVLAGRFRIVRRIGEGGMGVVFAALDELVDSVVAIKVLYPHLDDSAHRERLRREVRTLRSPHPGLVAVYDLHQDGNLWFLSMELVRGESLQDRLEREGRLPVAEAVRMGREVAEALEHLHGRGLVHRDVKPGNVLLDKKRGRARLCDAGLARPLARGQTVTETRMVVGTPAYMAPEQARGGELTGKSDVYSLGMTLYRVLTGGVPLQDRTAVSTLMLRQRHRPPPVRRDCPEAPRWLERLLRRMTDPHPGARPSAAAVARALTRERFTALPRRRTLAAVAAAGLTAAGAVLGAHAVREHRTLRVTVSPAEVRGVDREGRTTWTLRLARETAFWLQADFDGDGEKEWAVAGWNDPFSAGGPAARVLVVDRDGTVLTDTELATVIGSWPFPYPLQLKARLQAADLDGDGVKELVVRAYHPLYYPSALLVWWPRQRQWDVVLLHTGRLHDVTPLGAGRIGFTAVNNRLGMFLVAGVVEGIAPPRPGDGRSDALEVGRGRTTFSSRRFRMVTYVPLVEATSRGEVAAPGAGPGRGDKPSSLLVLLGDGRRIALDRFFNPVPGPNAGRDLAELRRKAVMWLVPPFLGRRSPHPQGESPRRLIETVRRNLGPLLQEPAYRAILAEKAARLLAASGDSEGALAVLEPAAADLGTDELRFLQANLLAVSGKLSEALAAVDALRLNPHTDRGIFDAGILAVDLAVQRGDPELLQRELADFITTVPKGRGKDTAVLKARAHLWWDRLESADLLVESGPYAPEGDAVAVLARWRTGHTRPGDLEIAETAVFRHPDAAAEAHLAAAAVLLARGQPDAACKRLAQLIPALELQARTDLHALQLWRLARGLDARAAAAAGDTATARGLARGLLREAAPGLLPWRLAREALETAGRSGR